MVDQSLSVVVSTDGDTPRARWQATCAALQGVFADVPPLDEPVDGCGRCFTDEELALLRGDPTLVPDALAGHFARKEPWHWGEAQYGLLWRRLAPRIVPQLLEQHTEPGMLLRGLFAPHTAFGAWPAAERAALMAAFTAALTLALTDGREPESIMDLLDGLTQASGDVLVWLAHIDAMAGPLADAGVVRLVYGWALDLLWGDVVSWWSHGDHTPTVTAWLCSRAVRDRLTRFAGTHPRCKNAAAALIAVDHLATGRRSPWYYPGYVYQCVQDSSLRGLVDTLNSG